MGTQRCCVLRLHTAAALLQPENLSPHTHADVREAGRGPRWRRVCVSAGEGGQRVFHKHRVTDRFLCIWGCLEGALGLLYEAREQRGLATPPGRHLRKGQCEGGQHKGPLLCLVTLSYTL